MNVLRKLWGNVAYVVGLFMKWVLVLSILLAVTYSTLDALNAPTVVYGLFGAPITLLCLWKGLTDFQEKMPRTETEIRKRRERRVNPFDLGSSPPTYYCWFCDDVVTTDGTGDCVHCGTSVEDG